MLSMNPFRRNTLARKPWTEKLRDQCSAEFGRGVMAMTVLRGPRKRPRSVALNSLDFRRVLAGRNRDE